MAEYTAVGKRIPRTDAQLQVTGRTVYGDDLTRPDMLFAAAHYSAQPHARIRRIDTVRAQGMPGVRAVITHRDVPHNRYGFQIHDQRVLAEDKVRYRGDCIAVVAADTAEQARTAADEVEVDYEPLPALLRPEQAMAEGAPLLHPDLFDSNIPHHLKIRRGDPEEAMKRAHRVVEGEYRTQKEDHAPIEPHVALCELEPDGKLVIWTSTSRVFHYVGVLVDVLRLPMNRIQVKTPSVGGAFGGKNEVMLEPWLALLTLKTGRPVKMTYSREEDLCTSTIRHAYAMRYRTGVDREGVLLGSRVEIIADCGAYLGLGKSTLTKAVVHACGPYEIPHVWVDGYLVYTNALVGSSMRGMGVPQVCFAWESHLDEIAHELGIDPLALRRKNLFGDSGRLPNGQVIRSAALRKTVDRAWELFEQSRERAGEGR